jgi:hypothetical protein
MAAALLVVVVAAGVVGCGSSGGPGTTGAAGTTTTLPPIKHMTGASDLILQVSTSGGLVPIESKLTSTPDFSLYGDGRVIITGPVIAIYPGPALPNLQTAVITEDEMQSLLRAAQNAGLFRSDFNYGHPSVTDMGTTTIVVNAAGKTYTSKIYALGMEENAGGVTDVQSQARAQVNTFNQRLSSLSGFVTRKLSWTAYKYTSLAVYGKQTAAASSGGSTNNSTGSAASTASTTSTDVQPNTLAWPLGDLATLGQPAEGGYRELLVSGQDLSTLSPLLAEATQITQWTSNGKVYNLYFRPLLPGQNR